MTCKYILFLCRLSFYSISYALWGTKVLKFGIVPSISYFVRNHIPLSSMAVVVQWPMHVQLFAIPWPAVCQASLSLTISKSLPKFMFLASVMPTSHLILWCPLLLPLIFPSIRNFSNELSVHIRWPKYWSVSFSISPSSEYSGLVFLKTDGFDLPAIQGTFRILLQHYSLKPSILWCSAFFMVQLS